MSGATQLIEHACIPPGMRVYLSGKQKLLKARWAMDDLSACALAKSEGIGDGTMLVTRAYGRRFLVALDAALRQRPEDAVVALDFRGVSVMDGSFADEAFG